MAITELTVAASVSAYAVDLAAVFAGKAKRAVVLYDDESYTRAEGDYVIAVNEGIMLCPDADCWLVTAGNANADWLAGKSAFAGTLLWHRSNAECDCYAADWLTEHVLWYHGREMYTGFDPCAAQYGLVQPENGDAIAYNAAHVARLTGACDVLWCSTLPCPDWCKAASPVAKRKSKRSRNNG